MLNIIDHLPRDSYYSEAVADDPEHARMVLAKAESDRAAGHQGGAAKSAVSMSSWSTQAGLLADLIDAVNQMRHVLVTANSKTEPERPKPYPRPVTAIDRARIDNRYAAHDRLAGRVLPHKRRERGD